MILEARSSSRRWTTVTLLAKRVRKVASSIAESPPPTTTMSWSRKKKPSQVAQADTPRPEQAGLVRQPERRGTATGRDDHGVGEVDRRRRP